MNNNLDHHGGINAVELHELGIDPGKVIDFSTNINAYGPCLGVRKALSEVDVSSYPDRGSRELRSLLSEKDNVPAEQILIGNGSSELIWLICFKFLNAGDLVLICGPTFSEYERCARLMGAHIAHFVSREEYGFRHTIASMEEQCTRLQPRMCFICNPNNPSGKIIDPSDLSQLISMYPDTWFVVDEAYLAFIDGARSVYQTQLKNLLVLRSMTKEYALAGLRLGYIIAERPIINELIQIRPAWNVNAAAQAAGIAALNDEKYLSSSLKLLAANKHKLLKGLGKIGVVTIPSATHYFLCKVTDAVGYRQTMLQNYKIQVRDCSSFGLPDFIRICTRTPDDNQQLLAAMKELSL